MTTTSRHDTWAAGDSYDAYMGRWSRPIAARFLDWLAGRKARRDGSAETVAVAFPATGGITYSPHWLDLKRKAGCSRDNELIASDFRRFCRQRDIALDAHNIEKVFINFCAKVGVV